MIVVDVEASGLDFNKHSLVSVGALDLKHPQNQFYAECRVWDGAGIMDEALEVNGFTREQVSDPAKKSVEEVMNEFMTWIQQCDEFTLAGQNPSFDRDFLQSSAARYHLNWPLAHRTLDLHSVAYAHLISRGIPIPLKNKHSALNLDNILEYCGMTGGEPKPHNALTGAKSAAECFSRILYNEKLLPEFDAFEIPWK
jgi:DNA polymerase III epsilon subunit-like protein